MSLFEYAQEIVSDILKDRESSMLSLSMETQPVMPMAQGGGLSSVQNSLNINGEPHRLAYINPSEKNLLQQLGGSGRKIDGIPAYYDPGDDSDPSSAEEGIGIGFDTSPAEAEAAVNAAQAEEAAVTAAIGEAEAYGNPEAQMNAPDLGFFGPGMTIDEQNFYDKANLSRQEFKEPKGFFESLKDNFNFKNNPLSFVSPTFAVAKAAIDSINSQKGFGMDPMGVVGEVGPETDLDDDDGTDAGGDDIIIKEKIAEVKQIPVKEVTVEEVQRAKRLTAAQRVAGTRLEDILDDIYGSGQGSELLSLAQSGGGIASLQKNININGQPHQLSYINPSEENLLKQLGGSGEKVNGIPAYMMGGADGDHGYGDAPSGNDSASTGAAAAGASASGGGDQAGGDDAPPEPEPEPVVAPKAPEVIIPKVEEPELPKQPRIVNTNLADILQTTYPNLSKSAIASMLGGLAAKEEKDSEEDFETDEEIINLLKKEGNPFPTPEDIQKYKSELNMKSILTQVYGNSNVLNNTGTA